MNLWMLFLVIGKGLCCSNEEAKLELEQIHGTDVLYVEQKPGGECSVKFRNRPRMTVFKICPCPLSTADQEGSLPTNNRPTNSRPTNSRPNSESDVEVDIVDIVSSIVSSIAIGLCILAARHLYKKIRRKTNISNSSGAHLLTTCSGSTREGGPLSVICDPISPPIGMSSPLSLEPVNLNYSRDLDPLRLSSLLSSEAISQFSPTPAGTNPFRAI